MPHLQSAGQAFKSLKTDPALDSVTLRLANYDQEKSLKKQMKVYA